MRRAPLGARSAQLGHQRAVAVEQFLGPVALHPVFEELEMALADSTSPIGT